MHPNGTSPLLISPTEPLTILRSNTSSTRQILHFQVSFQRSQQQLALTMRHDWASFAEKSVPSSTTGATWKRFTPSAQHALVLVTPTVTTETNFRAVHHCSFWAHAG